MNYDAHIHIALDGLDWRAALALHAQGASASEPFVRKALQAYADAGVGYLRDGGDKQGVNLLAAKLAPEYGIEFATPAFAIHKRGSYGSFLGRAYETLDDYKQLVDEALESGATFIKLMLSGILSFTEGNVVTGDPVPAHEMRQLVNYAHEQGVSVMAHVNGDHAVRSAIDAGVDSLEHGFYMGDEACDELAQANIVWVPTFAPLMAQLNRARTAGFESSFDVVTLPGGLLVSTAVLEDALGLQMSNVCQVARLGGLVACGTDAGSSDVLHGDAVVSEANMLREMLVLLADLECCGFGATCGDCSKCNEACAQAVLDRGLDALRKKFPGRR